FQISANQYSRIKAMMRTGTVTVQGKIDATLHPFALTLVHAYIRGTSEPQREVLLTAHLDHPKWSANDNASGSGAMLEIVRALKTLIAAKKIPAPERTLHFLWVPEFFGTMAWVAQHPDVRRCGDWDEPRNLGIVKPDAKSPCIVANLNLDMVGEDTVKTNSRFYITRTPDSVPSFLDPLLEDVMQQTREANLYAPAGTRHHWHPEMIAYTQGSDHDIFLGLGVPGAMFGHDPDWTHHSSEDTLDKTDPSEFRRVGTLAAAAAWWMAANPERWDGHQVFWAESRNASRYAHRLQHARLTQHPGQKIFEDLEEQLERPPAVPGPRRRALLPFTSSSLENLNEADRKLWNEQDARFSGGDSQLLPTEPNFDLIVFEAVNFMDGRRDARQIARLLSAEYLLEIDEAWVKRLIEVLARQGLVKP
ncbi:MAG: DUF4910 domain-containing protein, partial [Terriglobales bacterium]